MWKFPIFSPTFIFKFLKNIILFFRDLTNGPGKLTKALLLDKTYNGFCLTRKDADIYLIDNPGYKFKTMVSKRINIDYAEEWVEKPWRFYIKDNEYVTISLKEDEELN